MFEILKKKARKILGKDPIAIDGYSADQSEYEEEQDEEKDW